MIEIVYTGSAGSHRAFSEDGVAYRLVQGVPTEVPDELAERLCDEEGFEFADEATAPDPVEPETDDQDPTDEDEDPQGVNADQPYGEE